MSVNVNIFEVPPMSPEEKAFLMSNNISPDLIDLYIKVRDKILVYGKIEVRTTKNYLSFKHPYGRKDIKLGTLINVFFKQKHLVLTFNLRNTTPSDPKNILTASKGLGVCNYYTIIETGDDLSKLDYIIQQAIYCVSHTHRVVRINNRFITI